MRIFNLVATSCLLAGCGSSDNPERNIAAGDAVLPCAMSGAQSFTPVCAYERATTKEGVMLTINHPDGGFRRFLVTTDGRGIVTADGAEQAIVNPLGTHEVEVAVGADRYRLPATVKGGSAAAQ
jgi:hypothetical protein